MGPTSHRERRANPPIEPNRVSMKKEVDVDRGLDDADAQAMKASGA